MAGTFLSLDINAYGITAMIIKQVSKKPHIKETCHVNYKDLPETENNGNLFGTALADISKHLDMTSCSSATLLIPSSSVSFRNIELPFRSARKIKQILPLEIASQLPSPDEKYISDFHTLTIPNKEDLTSIFTASAVESDIENYIEVLSSYGIKPKVITPKGYASAISLLKDNPNNTNFICLDLGLHENTITLVYNQEPFFVRSFPVDQYKDEALADPVKQTLTGFRQHTGIDTYFDIFITAATELKDLKKTYYGLENFLNYQTRFKQTQDSLEQKPELKKIDRTALISALHPRQKMNSFFNFYKARNISDPVFQKNFKPFAATAFLACILLILYFYNFSLEIDTLNKSIKHYENQSNAIYKASFPGEKDVNHPLLKMQSRVKKAIKESNSKKNIDPSIKKSNYTAANVIAILSDSIPGTIDMEISKLSLSQTNLVMSGTTNNFKTVDKIKNSLEKSNMFKHISIDNATADKKTDRVLFKFTIQMGKDAS